MTGFGWPKPIRDKKKVACTKLPIIFCVHLPGIYPTPSELGEPGDQRASVYRGGPPLTLQTQKEIWNQLDETPHVPKRGGGAFLARKNRPPKMTQNDRFPMLFTLFFVFFSRLRRPSRVFSSFLALFLSFSSFLSASRLRREIFRDKKAPPLLASMYLKGGAFLYGGLS